MVEDGRNLISSVFVRFVIEVTKVLSEAIPIALHLSACPSNLVIAFLGSEAEHPLHCERIPRITERSIRNTIVSLLLPVLMPLGLNLINNQDSSP